MNPAKHPFRDRETVDSALCPFLTFDILKRVSNIFLVHPEIAYFQVANYRYLI